MYYVEGATRNQKGREKGDSTYYALWILLSSKSSLYGGVWIHALKARWKEHV